jgi:hypothetical protein
MTENKPLSFSANDWFYMQSNCKTNYDENSCASNESVVNQLKMSTNEFGASMTQYSDSKMLYNRELLFTFNLFVGLAMLCYYIYINQSAIPSPSDAISRISSIGKSMNGVTASLTNKLATPPLKV